VVARNADTYRDDALSSCRSEAEMPSRQLSTRQTAFFLAVGVWGIVIAILATGHHEGWAVFAAVVPLGILLGIGKVAAEKANRISKVGVQGGAGLQCPKCGGTQFKAKRSAGGKMALGVLAPKTRVRCVTCGTQYTRG
jgi:hypothetical protein